MKLFFFLLAFYPVLLWSQTTVALRPVYHDRQVKPGVPFLTENGDTIVFTTFKMYISFPELTDESGQTVPGGNYYLIDMEDPESMILFEGVQGFKHISFLLGTNTETNEGGILEGPMDPIHGMYWTWNSGYINFKLEGTSTSVKSPRHEFEFHIGGYLPPHTTVQHISLDIDPQFRSIYIELDLEKWLKSADLGVTNNVMIPGELASHLAGELANCLSVSYE